MRVFRKSAQVFPGEGCSLPITGRDGNPLEQLIQLAGPVGGQSGCADILPGGGGEFWAT